MGVLESSRECVEVGSGKNLYQGGQVRDCGSRGDNDQIKAKAVCREGKVSIQGLFSSKGIDPCIQFNVESKEESK